jgi:hypothetical protein
MLGLAILRPRHAPGDAGARWRLILVVTLACGCGRIGYDLLAGPMEGGPPGLPDATMRGAEASADVQAEGHETVEAAGMLEADVADSPLEGGCVTSPDIDYCSGLPLLPAPPVIDGVLDCGPALVPLVPVDWSGPAPLPPFPAGNSASLAAAWRPDGLYVFMSVTTPAAIPADLSSPVYYGAGVEVFVDSDGLFPAAPNYDNPGAIQLVVAAPPSQTMPGTWGEGYRNAVDQGPWASTQFSTFPTPTGFVFEGFVVAADLGLATWALASAIQIGFDVAVDVSYTTAAMTGPQGHRVGQYFLHVGASPIGLPYSDPRSFCTPLLDGP